MIDYKWAAVLSTVLAPASAWAQNVDHTVEYKMEGYSTIMHVLTPSGATCHVKSDSSFFGEQDFEVPFKFQAQPDYYYTFDCKLAGGQVWHQRLEPKANNTTIIRIGGGGGSPQARPSAPAADTAKKAMSADAFAKLKGAIENESFSKDKTRVLGLAAKSAYFSTEQVGTLIDAFDFSADKLEALKAVIGRVVDRENGYQILEHFTFAADKEAAGKLISQ